MTERTGLRWIGSSWTVPAQVLHQLGRYEEELELAAINRPYLHGRTKRWQARIAAMLGERDEAVRLLRSAFREGRRFGIWLHQDMYLESLRGYDPYEELVRPRE